MELKTLFSNRNVFIFLYVVSFLVYLAIGFFPAEALQGIRLRIDSIGFNFSVIKSEILDGNLIVPDYHIGSFSRNQNKVFLFGHSSTVFHNLENVSLNDEIYYDEKKYKVISREIIPKELINMNKILAEESESTIVLMTCAGKDLENMDATHRLILTAKAE